MRYLGTHPITHSYYLKALLQPRVNPPNEMRCHAELQMMLSQMNTYVSIEPRKIFPQVKTDAFADSLKPVVNFNENLIQSDKVMIIRYFVLFSSLQIRFPIHVV